MLHSIPLVRPHLQTPKTYSKLEGNIYQKTPPFCSRHHPKIPTSVKRRPRAKVGEDVSTWNTSSFLLPTTSRQPNQHHNLSHVARRTGTLMKPFGSAEEVSDETGSGKTVMKSRLHPILLRRTTITKQRDSRSLIERLQPTRGKPTSLGLDKLKAHHFVLHVPSGGGTPSRFLMRRNKSFTATNVTHQLDSPEERAWSLLPPPSPSPFPSSIWWREKKTIWQRGKKEEVKVSKQEFSNKTEKMISSHRSLYL